MKKGGGGGYSIVLCPMIKVLNKEEIYGLYFYIAHNQLSVPHFFPRNFVSLPSWNIPRYHYAGCHTCVSTAIKAAIPAVLAFVSLSSLSNLFIEMIQPSPIDSDTLAWLGTLHKRFRQDKKICKRIECKRAMGREIERGGGIERDKEKERARERERERGGG